MLTDSLTHAGEARPILWPISSRCFQSPVSYWERSHHARLLALVGYRAFLLVAVRITSRNFRRTVRLHCMEPYSHAFYTWALAKHGVKAGRAAGIAGAVGAILPDVPAFAGTIYFMNRDGRMWSEESLDAIYFSGPFGTTGSVLHSLVPVAALLLLYGLLRFSERDRRGILLWFLIGWAGHTIADFLTHVDDTRPLFWPISGWEWSSPISYYNPLYYGREFFLVNHGLMLLIAAWLLVKRLADRKKSTKSSTGEG